MFIEDIIYGDFEIKDQVLIELIESAPLQRLKGISQQGYPINETKTKLPVFSRYEHSVGVMLLLKILEANIEEQIAGLLHDISHTAFSHIIDWVVGDPTKENYQDENLSEFIKNSSIPKVLSKYGYDVERISNMEYNSNFGLLERKIPDLCADRLDYSLRDSYYWFNADVSYCINNLIVWNNEIVFNSRYPAETFGEYYMRCQRGIWGGEEAKLRYHLISMALKRALDQEIICMNDLYKDDMHVINKIRKSGTKEIVECLNKGLGELKFTKCDDGDILILKKFRYVDPKFIQDGKAYPLSSVDPDYKIILEEEKQRSKKVIKVKLIE